MMHDPTFREPSLPEPSGPEAGARAGLELLELIGRGEAGEAPAEVVLDWLRGRQPRPAPGSRLVRLQEGRR